jgi:hypothetical protein
MDAQALCKQEGNLAKNCFRIQHLTQNGCVWSLMEPRSARGPKSNQFTLTGA